MGDIQVLAGSNEAVRQSLLLCRFPGFTSVLGLIKRRGQSAKATEQAGTAEILFWSEREDSEAK